MSAYMSIRAEEFIYLYADINHMAIYRKLLLLYIQHREILLHNCTNLTQSFHQLAVVQALVVLHVMFQLEIPEHVCDLTAAQDRVSV